MNKNANAFLHTHECAARRATASPAAFIDFLVFYGFAGSLYRLSRVLRRSRSRTLRFAACRFTDDRATLCCRRIVDCGTSRSSLADHLPVRYMTAARFKVSIRRTKAYMCAVYNKVSTVPISNPLDVVTTRKRPTAKELDGMRKAEEARVKQQTKAFWLPNHLSGMPSDTWPKPLRMFSFSLPEPRSRYRSCQSTTPEIIASLRQHYPEDDVLMRFADFLDSAIRDDPKVTFETSYEQKLLPRNPDGSICLPW